MRLVIRFLVKQIFAYQPDERRADDIERDAHDQQIGEHEFPADGMEGLFNPCQ